MNFLVVSDREYKKTSRGIDIITSYLADKGHNIDHLVFFKRNIIPEKKISDHINQLYFYDPIKIYRSRLQFLFPGFLLLSYFKYMIRRQSSVNFNKYDYVILEGGHPIYLAEEIETKIIYRQSDPINICFNSNRNFYKKLEEKVINKSFLITSALENVTVPKNFMGKIFYWHSGFIPFERVISAGEEKSIIVMGGEIDWNLLKKLAKKYSNYQFNVIGITNFLPIPKNIKIKGYMDFESYKNILSSAITVIIPFSNNYIKHLHQVYYTAKILISMNLGLPILLRGYGNFKNTDTDKKLFVYNSKKDAIPIFDNIIKNIENEEIDINVKKETRTFLFPHTVENRIKELDKFFKPVFENSNE